LEWGVENGTNYCLAANSWGATFGKLGGFVKVLRGVNHLNVESTVPTGRVSAKFNAREILITPDNGTMFPRTTDGCQRISGFLLINFVVFTVMSFA
jgi:hypothetical protein